MLADHVEAIITADESFSETTSQVAERMLEILPGMASHICVNSGHDLFGDEIVGTQTQHLVEHAAIELETMEARFDRPGIAHVFTGHTSSFRGAVGQETSRMLVALTYEDDLVVLSSLQRAVDLIVWASSGYGPLPDTERIVHELHDFRRA